MIPDNTGIPELDKLPLRQKTVRRTKGNTAGFPQQLILFGQPVKLINGQRSPRSRTLGKSGKIQAKIRNKRRTVHYGVMYLLGAVDTVLRTSAIFTIDDCTEFARIPTKECRISFAADAIVPGSSFATSMPPPT